MINKYGKNSINDAIMNAKDIFREYNYNQNRYLEKDEIN